MFTTMLALACATPTTSSPPSAVLDEQNWLQGSFVDAYDPNVTDVELMLVQRSDGIGPDTLVTYRDGDVVVFGFRAPAIPVPDESNPFPTAPAPSLLFSEDDVDFTVDEVGAFTLEWHFVDADETAIEGSFALSFLTGDAGWYDIEGAFAGPVARFTL